MSVTGTFDFEGAGPSGTTLTTGNTGYSAVTSVGGGTGVSSSAHPREGSLGAKLDCTTSQNLILRHDVTASGLNANRWYGWIDAAPPAVTPISQALSTSTVRARLRLNTDRTIALQNGSTTVATSTTAIPTGQLFRVEWKLNNSGATQAARLFIGANVNGTTADEEISGTFNTGTFNRTQVGILANPAGAWTLYVDHHVNDNADWVGPLPDAADLADLFPAFYGM
jgi:hypothetical protein